MNTFDNELESALTNVKKEDPRNLASSQWSTPKQEKPLAEHHAARREKYNGMRNSLLEVLTIDPEDTEAKMALEWVDKKLAEMTQREQEEITKLTEAKKREEEERVKSESEAKRREGETDKLVSKLSQCIDFQSLYALEEEFNKVGLTIQTTSNNRMILCKLMEGRPVANNVIEDYVFIGGLDTATRELTDRSVTKICDFVRMNAGSADKVRNVARVWRNGLRIYESTVNIMNEDVNHVAGELLVD